jgi:2-polyprenyl-3-methyl-5-hydroxy-6-metoxy-1,4-benzoquinol methylase
MSTTDDQALEINRRHWDAMSAIHGEGRDTYYDIDRLLVGSGTLSDLEEYALTEALAGRDLAKLDVVHVQCHIGFDAISLARRGARVVGYDFSPAALAKARTFAERAGVDVEFVETDATDVPASLHGRFDLAWATIGVIGWIRDLDAWMRQVAAVLRPGGRLVLVEIHPMLNMLATVDPIHADFPYAFDGARAADTGGSYADSSAPLADTETVQFGHSIGETVTSAVRAGLRVVALHEHFDTPFDPRGEILTQEADGRFRARLDGEALPVLFTLIAEKGPA